jgi:hypothetical protein
MDKIIDIIATLERPGSTRPSRPAHDHVLSDANITPRRLPAGAK